MTNATDFRRYAYTANTTSALEAFNVTRTAAPAPEVRRQRKKSFTVIPNTVKKTKKELVTEQKVAFKKVAVILTVTLLALSMLFGVVFTFVQKSELTHSIAKSKSQIAIAESENVSLKSKLEAMVSVSQIDRYAVEELGMTKLQSSQIRYIDTSKYKEERSASLESQLPENISDATE